MAKTTFRAIGIACSSVLLTISAGISTATAGSLDPSDIDDPCGMSYVNRSVIQYVFVEPRFKNCGQTTLQRTVAIKNHPDNVFLCARIPPGMTYTWDEERLHVLTPVQGSKYCER